MGARRSPAWCAAPPSGSHSRRNPGTRGLHDRSPNPWETLWRWWSFRSCQHSFDRRLDFRDAEGLARHLVERSGIDQELVTQHRLELAGVHLGHENLFVTLEQVTEILRHRPDVAN